MQIAIQEKIEVHEKNDPTGEHLQSLIKVHDCDDEVLQGLLTEKTKLLAQLEVLKTLSDDKRQRALQGESLHLEVQNDIEVLTHEMEGVMDDITHLVGECDEIELQVDSMRKGSGMSFWPIPQIHSEQSFIDVGRNVVVIKPCGYCNKGFPNMDVAVTPCKHTFHPFCLGVMLKTSNKCLVCKEYFHPDWWNSWGFGEPDEKLIALAKEMHLDSTRQVAIENIRSSMLSIMQLEACMTFMRW